MITEKTVRNLHTLTTVRFDELDVTSRVYDERTGEAHRPIGFRVRTFDLLEPRAGTRDVDTVAVLCDDGVTVRFGHPGHPVPDWLLDAIEKAVPRPSEYMPGQAPR